MIYYSTHIKFLLFAILFLTAAPANFAAEGDLDLSFDGDGIVITNNDSGNESIVDLTVQPDGKIIAIGYGGANLTPETRAVIVRYNPDGSIDSTFGTSGKVIVPPLVPRGLALQSNGKIVFAGTIGTSPNNDFYVGRLNADGSFDATFNGTGAAVLDLRGSSDSAASVKIQLDGKILVGGGSRRTAAGDSPYDFAVARFNPDGSLDATFDGDGKVFTMILPTGETASIAELAVQPDGKILATGTVIVADTPGGNPIGTFASVRYNSNGSLDTIFDGDGVVTTRFISTAPPGSVPNNYSAHILLQSDGKIVVVGTATTCCSMLPPISMGQFAAARYNTDGSLDDSFANGGKALISFPGSEIAGATAAAIQADNKIVIVGSAGNPKQKHAAIARLNPNGSLDATFSGDGRNVAVPSTSGSSSVSAVAIQPDGKILGGGSLSFNGSIDFLLARFEASSCLANCFPLRQKVADFDGDGKTDLSVFRSSNAYWYILNSSRGFSSVQWGLPTDRLVPGDYDGDGRTDTAVYRNGTFSSALDNNTWYILRSSDNTLFARQFGSSTGFSYGTPVPADYDGDGKTDLAVYDLQDTVGTPGSFRILQSSNNSVVIRQWGLNTDSRVPADYDGDGKTDLAVYRPSNGVWYIQRSRDGFYAIQFGLAEDKPTVGDYDGDGKADQAVYRPLNGVWYVWGSKDNSFSAVQFGVSTDKPVSGDYDGDGKTDYAVYRDGTWYLLNSTSGFAAFVFGTATDRPIPNVS